MTTPNLLNATNLTQQGLLNTPTLLAGTETTIYTVPANKAVKIATASLCNTSISTVIVSVSMVPSGGTASNSNRVIANYSLLAHDTITTEDGLAPLAGAMLGDGQFISVLAGTASAVTMIVTGTVTT